VLSHKDKEALQESLELVKEAIHKSPRSASFYDTLGWIKYRMGEIDEATGLLRQAVQGMPRSPEVHYHLGVVEKAAGHKSLARWHLNAALEHARTSQRDGRKPTPSVVEVERQAREALDDLDEG
jgi:Flp pilus assembly protein TadD